MIDIAENLHKRTHNVTKQQTTTSTDSLHKKPFEMDTFTTNMLTIQWKIHVFFVYNA